MSDERAEFIRVQIESAKRPNDMPLARRTQQLAPCLAWAKARAAAAPPEYAQ